MRNRNKGGRCKHLFAFVHICSRLLAFVFFSPLRLLAFVNVCLHLFAFARICLLPPLSRPPLRASEFTCRKMHFRTENALACSKMSFLQKTALSCRKYSFRGDCLIVPIWRIYGGGGHIAGNRTTSRAQELTTLADFHKNWWPRQANKTLLSGEKKNKQKKTHQQNFRGIVPGFAGDCVYVFPPPQATRNEPKNHTNNILLLFMFMCFYGNNSKTTFGM